VAELAKDTAIEPCGRGRFSAVLSREWEIWGPMGGYVAAIALRAAGAAGSYRQPASFFCHYLGVAEFDRIDLHVTKLRVGRSAMSQRVAVTQGDRPIIEATIWSVEGNDGLEHDECSPPDVPGPYELQPRTKETAPPTFPFWDNVEMRPVRAGEPWPPAGPLPPVWQAWCRFRPTGTHRSLAEACSGGLAGCGRRGEVWSRLVPARRSTGGFRSRTRGTQGQPIRIEGSRG
jgi:acyl-CoA thioesterase II